jgi:DNA processing protein
VKFSSITLDSRQLPEKVASWPKHPKMLWCIGDLLLLQLPLVSVIGSRNASREGIARTRRITQLLIRAGVGVVSGLAEGIDAAAHMEALRLGGKTIAVMGTPIDECYPAKHLQLKEEIMLHGLVISQFAPESSITRGNFPKRNELMAALSIITLVAEAGPTSGTRHQVACALKLKRRVGFLASLTSKGIPWIDEALTTDFAFIINEPEDVFKELEPFLVKVPQVLLKPDPESKLVYPDYFPPISQLDFPVEILEIPSTLPDFPQKTEVEPLVAVIQSKEDLSESPHKIAWYHRFWNWISGS